jgi:tetratricopeptide (TPR) repeat protein
MQEVTAEERRGAALALFQAGKYEEAAREFRADLDERETSEGWNDWAAAETMCGRIEAAIAGFTRALQVDPANAQAKQNLLALREQCLKTMEATQANGSKSGKAPVVEQAPACTAEQASDAALQSFINALEQIPLCDPTLPAWLREALERSSTDCSYVVREGYRLFTLLAEGARCRKRYGCCAGITWTGWCLWRFETGATWKEAKARDGL